MNLADILKRKDRSLRIDAGDVTEVKATVAGQRHRALMLSNGASIVLIDAHTFTLLKDFPRELNWQVLAQDGYGGGLLVSLRSHNPEEIEPFVLCRIDGAARDGSIGVMLDWPVQAGWFGFDLHIDQLGEEPTTLGFGTLANSRGKFGPFLKGRGVEVGPGLSPHVLPSMADVQYVEEKHPSEWQATYAGGSATLDRLTPEIIERYTVGSAVTLDGWADDSLDFIFSNHVFEHLPNPLQVLENWWKRLKPNGVILGATPDARGCFDLRQPLSTAEQFKDDYARGGFEITDRQYENWCRYTNPDHKPEALKARKYSVHVHYYTPSVFRQLVDLLNDRACPCDLFLETIPNNKDFGFIIRKRQPAGSSNLD